MWVALAAEPSPALSACEQVRAQRRLELCGPSPSADERATCDQPPLPCEVSADLDGDGKPEVVSLTRQGAAVGLAVRWSSGEAVVVTPLVAVIDEEVSSMDEMSWLVGWRAAPAAEGVRAGLVRAPLPPGSLGDGVWMTGTDAASVLVKTALGLRLVHLGY